MTRDEFAKIAMALKTYYPRETLLPNAEAVSLWYEQLKDIDYRVAAAALHKWVGLNKWSPSIAEFRMMASEIVLGELPDWGEAWEKVRKAMRNFGSYRPVEAMATLDDLTQRAVNQAGGFVHLCLSESYETDRANFRIIYTALAERERREAALPEGLKAMIARVRAESIEGSSEKEVEQNERLRLVD